MTDHYDILGLKPGASHPEIKNAFRRLAKMYHPDKHPDAKEHFIKILKAYEVLSDPVLKSSYDYKLNYHQSQNHHTPSQKSNTKTWRFDDKELKRRQYYNEHFKKNNKTTAQYKEEVESKKTYNEYKYILFATPLAVALFLLIMKLAMPAQPTLVHSATPSAKISAAADSSQLKLGDMPYAAFFGGSKYDTAYSQNLTVKNLGQTDAIVCLFTKHNFIRSFYMKPDYSAQVAQLPAEPLFVRYSSGLNFRYAAPMAEPLANGAFTKDLHFFKRKKALLAASNNELILQAASNEFAEIGEHEFFKKTSTNHDKKN